MFIRNKWYIVAEPDELASGPISRVILGRKIVVFRTESGQLAILEDRCPHRLVPLSLGSVRGEALRCLLYLYERDEALPLIGAG